MKKIISLEVYYAVIVALIIVVITSASGCFKDDGYSIYNYGNIVFKTDTDVIIKNDDNDTYRIKDTSLNQWKYFLFVTNSSDTSKLLRGVFYVYETTPWRSRYSEGYYIYGYYIYLTNGIDNIMFETKSSKGYPLNYPTGTILYVFYSKKCLFKTKQLN